jgi:hypothetical protein
MYGRLLSIHGKEDPSIKLLINEFDDFMALYKN